MDQPTSGQSEKELPIGAAIAQKLKAGIKTQSKYWASLAQYKNDPQFIENSHKEFQSSPLQEEDGKDGFNRRDFMKLMAASTALASSACFKRPIENIMPYVNQPEEVTMGIPNYYASTCGECSAGCGMLVKTREGRPIKLEGNPDHVLSKGALCARGQASILNLYDPDRYKNPFANSSRGTNGLKQTTWADADKAVIEKLKAVKSGSGQIRILSGGINSPSTLKIMGDFLSGFSHGSHVMFEPASTEQVVQAQELSYGTKVMPRYRFDLAEMVVSIDADFLGTYVSPVEFTKQWVKNRKLSKKRKTMSKLVAFESAPTITGTNADERMAIRPQDGARVAIALASELSKLGVGGAGESAEFLKSHGADSLGSLGYDPQLVKATAKELMEKRGKSLVIAGSPQSQTENGLSLQIAVNLLNSMLGNDGVTVDHSVSPSMQGEGSYTDLAKLIKDMNEGHVEALFIYKSNPAFSTPREMGFADALKKVKLVVSFNDHQDETALLADYVMPDHHALENWGDAQPQKNLYSVVQPTIRPVFDTRAFQDSLITLGKGVGVAKLAGATSWYHYVQDHWRETVYKEFGIVTPFELFWEGTLRDGVFDGIAKRGGRAQTGHARAFKAAILKSHLPKENKNTEFDLVLYPQIAQGDGRSGNNPWLQELPDPVTRAVWDNYVSVAPKTAEKLNLIDGDMVRVQAGGKTFELPAQVQPGLHEKVVAVALGYGHENVGQVGTGIGKNMFQNVVYTDDGPVVSGMAASVKKTGAKYTLALAQDHHTLEGRPIVKDATLKEYQENPSAGNEEHEKLTTLWSGYEYKGYRWGMSIDLNSCTGCGACVIGCQAENNVPVVGKAQVNVGRIMHWIRIDRYYTGTPDNPKVAHQPMLCQHCENAPCETVCPVLATMHDSEGINQQIYNRCVGTRYCNNNCPYKVRRFNWVDYNFHGQVRYPMTLQQNPEVTVRSRGIMEKCSFCIQRVTDAKNKARDLNRPVKDGELQTACQQTCPGDAIVFGNVNDPQSMVTENARDPRGFHVLEELNTRPSITYLTKIRNVEA